MGRQRMVRAVMGWLRVQGGWTGKSGPGAVTFVLAPPNRKACTRPLRSGLIQLSFECLRWVPRAYGEPHGDLADDSASGVRSATRNSPLTFPHHG